VIIVEGKKDKLALEKLEVTNIIVLKKGIDEFCQSITQKYSEAIILTDLDSEGKKLYAKIRYGLERDGVKIDDSFRNFLYRETCLRQIEGIDTYLFSLIKKNATAPAANIKSRK
jgi:5S rRNA maturation endonuclease (ribonuclease M5)